MIRGHFCPLFLRRKKMYVGERFEKDGKTYEVTSVFGTNYGYKEVKEEKVELPVFVEKVPKKTTKKKG